MFDSADVCPPGDPEAIAAFALKLRGIAAQATGTNAPLLECWKSPGAGQVTEEMRYAYRASERAADVLRSCASMLDGAADAVASDQRAWRMRQGEHR